MKFDFNTIKDFDDHILKSIPNYDVLINNIMSMSEYFITKDTVIYDLGCSTGKLLKSIPYPNEKIGYDNAAIMPDDDSEVRFINADLNSNFEMENACIAYSIFTMQFLNRSSRKQFCKTVYDGLNDGGAFIICEKIYQSEGLFQEIMAFTHYDYKCQNFTEQEIIKKERDLRYIMKPSTMQKNMELLSGAGFKRITTFWQSYNFVGLIAVK
jgi:tRNA (cmo5U34)-methyltransferase